MCRSSPSARASGSATPSCRPTRWSPRSCCRRSALARLLTRRAPTATHDPGRARAQLSRPDSGPSARDVLGGEVSPGRPEEHGHVDGLHREPAVDVPPQDRLAEEVHPGQPVPGGQVRIYRRGSAAPRAESVTVDRNSAIAPTPSMDTPMNAIAPAVLISTSAGVSPPPDSEVAATLDVLRPPLGPPLLTVGGCEPNSSVPVA